ncbi:hypothetical protein [Parasitella parasitica]|uniref:Dihydropteridine reductase n=1 Tax=Parasitella parasitica TaxID=35722 RepID=A0A0B7NUR6_9FUNG|nr:hypothetical protein [Parasitella parasitica]
MSAQVPKSHHAHHPDMDERQKRPKKYDKFNTNSLRRDLLMSNFDRTLVVEKAKFEPSSSSSNSQENSSTANQAAVPTIPTQHDEKQLLPKIEAEHTPDSEHPNLSNKTVSPPTSAAAAAAPATSTTTHTLTTSPSAPTLSTTTTMNTDTTTTPTINAITHNPPAASTLHSVISDPKRKLTPIKSESNGSPQPTPTRSPTAALQNNRKVMKKQSKSTMNGTASPAEVFHRNLVDAVSNVDDSDENEHYVYPYSGNELNTSGMHRPLSVRSTPASLLDWKKRSGRGFGDWLRQTLYKKPAQRIVDEEEEDLVWSGSESQQQQRRPKLRNHVKDHQQQPNRSSLLNLWNDSFNTNYLSPSSAAPKKKYYSTQNHASSYIGQANRNGGYTSDDEAAPLISTRRQKRPPFNKQKKTCTHTLQNLLLSLILLMLLLMLVVVYRAQPLMELSVDMGRILATDKELIFDLKVKADNWNWWSVHVAEADISVFAFSQIVPSSNIIVSDKGAGSVRGVDPAEYLGGLTYFDEPLSIPSNRFNHDRPLEAISQIRIKSPGADASGNERWSRMIRYPYGLVVRGVLKYKPVPFLLGTYPQSVAICNVTQVDPTTGAVSTDPDRTVCSTASQDTFVISVDFNENKEANHNILATSSGSLAEQGESINASLASVLKSEKLRGIFCVAGGWAGGNAANQDFLKSSELMLNQSVHSSLIAAHIASKHLEANGLLTLTGALAALDATPGMIGYGIAKAAVHHLVKDLAASGSGLPEGCKVTAVLPVTIDTPMNRKYMPGSDFSTWTSPDDIANIFVKLTKAGYRQLEGYLTGTLPLESGKLVQAVTEQIKAFIPSYGTTSLVGYKNIVEPNGSVTGIKRSQIVSEYEELKALSTQRITVETTSLLITMLSLLTDGK